MIVGSIIFISIYQLSSFAYENMFHSQFFAHTKIGKADVAGLSKNEGTQVLKTEENNSYEWSTTIVRTDLKWTSPSILQEGTLTFEVKPEEYFSLIDWAKTENLAVSNEQLSELASHLWEGVLSTDLTVVERHVSESLLDGVVPGLEAKVDLEKNLDFGFHNQSQTSTHFSFLFLDSSSVSLTITRPEATEIIRYSFVQEEVYEPRKVIQYVSKDDKRVGTIEAGKNGVSIKINREYLDHNGNVVKTEIVAEDTYLPKHEIEYLARQ